MVSTCILLRRTQTIYLQSVSCVRRTLTIYLQSVSCGLLTYLAFAWLTALTNQVIRLVGHRQFTCSLCSLTQTEAGNSNSNSGKPSTYIVHAYSTSTIYFLLCFLVGIEGTTITNNYLYILLRIPILGNRTIFLNRYCNVTWQFSVVKVPIL